VRHGPRDLAGPSEASVSVRKDGASTFGYRLAVVVAVVVVVVVVTTAIVVVEKSEGGAVEAREATPGLFKVEVNVGLWDTLTRRTRFWGRGSEWQHACHGAGLQEGT
jgi:hypothetical protein